MRLRSPFNVAKDDGGNVAIITALCILPLTVLVGMSIDLSNATRTRVALQDASDSAALAIARNIDSIADANKDTAAKNYIAASFDKKAPYIATATIDRTNLTVTVSATAEVPTIFAGLLGKTKIPVSAYSEVKGQGFDYEIVMVLDNSGSMAYTLGVGSTKIAELKKAANALVSAMMTTASSGRVKIGIVPFSSAVNIGTGNSGATWIATSSAQASYYNENLTASTFNGTVYNRLQLNGGNTNGMRNTSWAGCVESRPIKVGSTTVDYDIDDTTPSSAKADSLFVPWFAPDEPDSSDGWFYDSYSNNYLDDDGGNCTSTLRNGANTQERKQNLACKYYRVTPSTSSGKGPNYQCDVQAITPLTATKSTLDTAIANLVAEGNTNVPEGMAWGWRVLSPTAPFTEGAAYSTKNLSKVIILMTDGQNNIPSRNTQNKSIYSSYGYMKDNRLNPGGAVLDTTSKITAKMDERLTLACTKAKAAGITVYTVALGTDADAALLKTCATKDAYAYAPTTGAELTPVFQAIAASINKLRLAK